MPQATKRTTTARRPRTFDHIRSQKKPVIKTCWISGDSEVADDYQEQLRRVTFLRTNVNSFSSESTKSDLAKAEARLSELEAEYRRTAIKFQFKSITRRQFEKLTQDHPLTPTKKKEYEDKGQDVEGLLFDPETFAPALVEICSYDPLITAQDYVNLSDDENWSAAEVGLLYETAMAACTTTNRYTLGNA